MAEQKAQTPQAPSNVAPPPQYSISQFQQYIQLFGLFNGGTAKSIVVSQQFLDWYRIQVKQVAKNFNIPEGKGNSKDEFMGVELIANVQEIKSKKTT